MANDQFTQLLNAITTNTVRITENTNKITENTESIDSKASKSGFITILGEVDAVPAEIAGGYETMLEATPTARQLPPMIPQPPVVHIPVSLGFPPVTAPVEASITANPKVSNELKFSPELPIESSIFPEIQDRWTEREVRRADRRDRKSVV